MTPHILAENDYLIAINKPAGLITHSDGRTIEPSVSEWIGKVYPRLIGVGGAWISPQGESILLNGLVHRLDRTTSGILLAAKNDDAFDYLRNEFKSRRIKKKYLAWVAGSIQQESGIIIAEIMRSNAPPKKWYAKASSIDNARAAITEWTVLQRGDTATLVEAVPITGRTHQIRVHFAFIGHPVIGDAAYGSSVYPVRECPAACRGVHPYSTNEGFNASREFSNGVYFHRPALHAKSVSLTLPDGIAARYIAPEPDDFLLLSGTPLPLFELE